MLSLHTPTTCLNTLPADQKLLRGSPSPIGIRPKPGISSPSELKIPFPSSPGVHAGVRVQSMHAECPTCAHHNKRPRLPRTPCSPFISANDCTKPHPATSAAVNPEPRAATLAAITELDNLSKRSHCTNPNNNLSQRSHYTKPLHQQPADQLPRAAAWLLRCIPSAMLFSLDTCANRTIANNACHNLGPPRASCTICSLLPQPHKNHHHITCVYSPSLPSQTTVCLHPYNIGQNQTLHIPPFPPFTA